MRVSSFIYITVFILIVICPNVHSMNHPNAEEILAKYEGTLSALRGPVVFKSKSEYFFEGDFPPYYTELKPVYIEAGDNCHYWVTGQMDSTIMPNVYRGFCIISGDNISEYKIPLIWEVLPILLDPPNKSYGIYHPIKLGSGAGAGGCLGP